MFCLESQMKNWWKKLSDWFCAMAYAEAGDFDSVRDILNARTKREGP